MKDRIIGVRRPLYGRVMGNGKPLWIFGPGLPFHGAPPLRPDCSIAEVERLTVAYKAGYEAAIAEVKKLNRIPRRRP